MASPPFGKRKNAPAAAATTATAASHICRSHRRLHPWKSSETVMIRGFVGKFGNKIIQLRLFTTTLTNKTYSRTSIKEASRFGVRVFVGSISWDIRGKHVLLSTQHSLYPTRHVPHSLELVYKYCTTKRLSSQSFTETIANYQRI